MRAPQGPPAPPLRLPAWLRVKVGKREQGREMRELMEGLGLNTVCSSARCPNLGECYTCGTATFLIMGNRCTRDCRFCAVPSGAPEALDPEEAAWRAREWDKLYGGNPDEEQERKQYA